MSTKMLFNSPIFMFLFLPLVAAGYHLLSRSANQKVAILWLSLSSIFFYGYWNPVYLALISSSIIFNYSVGRAISIENFRFRKGLFVFGLVANLSALAYFKYANFFVDNLNALTGIELFLNQIALPLAISFFTLQQVAYLVDVYRDKIAETSFLYYVLFVSFFPQLIAGPIVHHKQMLPQFREHRFSGIGVSHLSLFLSWFSVGIFKKVFIADNLAIFANPLFDGAEALSFVSSWVAALSYTLQLYFDFSGYSDMAIGLGFLFGIKLPLNFNSPYKSVNIVDFWRRWHMTLSQFLRDYVYIPLGGNRKGKSRRYTNLMLTMLIGGIWHGAGWTFLVWGALHGFYLLINHAFQASGFKMKPWAGKTITLFAVIFAWVVFRATTIGRAAEIWTGMLDFGSFSLADLKMYAKAGFWIAFSGVIALAAPNMIDLMDKDYKLRWEPSVRWGLAMAILFSLALLSLNQPSEFLYFQF